MGSEELSGELLPDRGAPPFSPLRRRSSTPYHRVFAHVNMRVFGYSSDGTGAHPLTAGGGARTGGASSCPNRPAWCQEALC